jgi:hypothetical protein
VRFGQYSNSICGGALAGAIGGASVGSPSPSKYRRTDAGSVMKAMIRILWPHAGHTSTWNLNTRASRAAHAKRYLVEPDFFLSSEGVFPLLSAGTTFARCLAFGARIP